MARKLYPIGLQTFERIRVEDKFYIDKTEYVYRMAHTDGTYFFLSRPRRFGKSLLLTTMQSYFEGKVVSLSGIKDCDVQYHHRQDVGAYQTWQDR